MNLSRQACRFFAKSTANPKQSAFLEHTFVQCRDKTHKKCESNKRSMQSNGASYKTHQRRPRQQACISCTGCRRESQRSRHLPLASRSPKEGWNNICRAESDTNETGQGKRSIVRSEQQRKAQDRRQAAQQEHLAIPQLRYCAIPCEAPRCHRDRK